MEFINLTPHAITLNDGSVFEPSGIVARVTTGYSPFDEMGISKVTFGEVQNMPEPRNGVIYIVSGLVATALKGKREDVVSPATGHPFTKRDANGQIISVPGFVKN